MRDRVNKSWDLFAREMVFRLVCRHRQGGKPNILLHCMPRSGSTWVLNTVAAHPSMRYMGRAFMSSLNSRWRHLLPDLGQTADCPDHAFGHFIHFEGESLERFEAFAREIVMARRHIYPALSFRAPYFHRKTDRIIIQVHTISAMIEWFDKTFPIQTAVMLRHPIPNVLAIIRLGYADEGADFLNHQWFVETHLTGPQVDLGQRILERGSPRERHVLDWSLRTLVPIRAIESGAHPDWLLLTYEQMVLEPEKTVRAISDRLDLPDVDTMLRQIARPSRTVTRSTVDEIADPQYLLDRWRSKVDEKEEQELMRIPAAFEIDVYSVGRSTPTERFMA